MDAASFVPTPPTGPIYASDAIQATPINSAAFYASRQGSLLWRSLDRACSLNMLFTVVTYIAVSGRFIFCNPLMAPASIPACLQWTHLTHLVARFFFCGSPLVLIECLVISVISLFILSAFLDTTRFTYQDYLKRLFQKHLAQDELVAAEQILQRMIPLSGGMGNDCEFLHITLAIKYAQRNNPTSLRQALDQMLPCHITANNPLLDNITSKFAQIEQDEKTQLQQENRQIVQLIPIIPALQEAVLAYLDSEIPSILPLIRFPTALDAHWKDIFYERLSTERSRSADYYSVDKLFDDWVPYKCLRQEHSKVLRAVLIIKAEQAKEQREKELDEAEELEELKLARASSFP